MCLGGVLKVRAFWDFVKNNDLGFLRKTVKPSRSKTLGQIKIEVSRHYSRLGREILAEYPDGRPAFDELPPKFQEKVRQRALIEGMVLPYLRLLDENLPKLGAKK